VNKTLLIIICDFLLISILALVEFNPSVEEALVDDQSLKEEAAEEMLELLQLSLEHESSQRREVENLLESTEDELGQTRQSLDETTASLQETSSSLEKSLEEKSQLASSLEDTRSSLSLTIQEKANLESTLSAKEQHAQTLQDELRKQQETVQLREEELAKANENLGRLETAQQSMSTELKILDTEKQMLLQNLVTARAEVDRARIEAEQAQQRAESLAAGVSELAAESTALKEEIRQAQPLSMNTIYQQFVENRVFIRFEWVEKYAFSTTEKQSALQSVMLQTANGVVAVFAMENTPLGQRDTDAWLKVGNRSVKVSEMGYLDAERRIGAVRVPQPVVESSGLKVFTPAGDPLRFSNAVLIKDDQEMYGEIPVRIPPGESGFLEVETRLFNRLFGEFSPSVGDFVFSMTGELTGIMIKRDRARILDNPTVRYFDRLP
jgi:hypothetical protein